MNWRVPVAGLLCLLSTAAQADWQLMSGLARDIGVGARGDTWVVGVDEVPGGSSIHRFTGGDWQVVPGGAVRIDVDPQGYPWVVNSSGQILRLTPNGWQPMPGLATDIGIGADGTVWVVGVTPTEGGYTLHRWNGRDWELFPGGAVRIDVDPAGNPWVVNDRGDILRYYRGAWQNMGRGLAIAIAIGSDGEAWMLSVDRTFGGQQIFRWTGRQWRRVRGGAVSLAAGPVAWVTNDRGNIYRWDRGR